MGNTTGKVTRLFNNKWQGEKRPGGASYKLKRHWGRHMPYQPMVTCGHYLDPDSNKLLKNCIYKTFKKSEHFLNIWLYWRTMVNFLECNSILSLFLETHTEIFIDAVTERLGFASKWRSWVGGVGRGRNRTRLSGAESCRSWVGDGIRGLMRLFNCAYTWNSP